MPTMTLEQFRRDLLNPAQRRCRELENDVAAAASEYEAAIRSPQYDDREAAAAALRLRRRSFELGRWQERLAFLEGCENGRDALNQVFV
jgi:hypothetical protein